MSRISFDVGTSYHPGWTIRDQTGKAVNLDGVAITFAVYPTPYSPVLPNTPDPWFVKTIGSGIAILDMAGGVIRVDFSQYDTDAPPNNLVVYPWEMRMIDTSGEDRAIDSGFLILRPRRLDLGTSTPPPPP